MHHQYNTQKMEMQHHLLHEHPLELVRIGTRYDDDDDHDHDAAGCDDALSGETYACKTCRRFYLHQPGSNLPQRIEHSFHPCPLFLKHVPRRSQGGSDHPEMMLSYRCELCNFEMDAASGQMIQSSCSGEEGSLLHFSHRHPLKHSSKEVTARSDCDMCRKCIPENSYSCQSCEYYLHEYCAGLPRVIRHFFHPCLLVLKLMDHFPVCDACRDFRKKRYGCLVYRCTECNFDMHPECTQFSPVGSDEERILHFAHHHPLKLTYDEADKTHACYVCKKPAAGRKYECRSCRFYLHETCRDVPREIRHFFHPCTLKLEALEKTADCDACLGKISGIVPFGYRCKECDFKMHVACTRLYPIGPDDDEGDRIRDLSHYHPLKLSQEAGPDSVDCNLCSRRIAGQAYGACEPCRFYIHKTCMNLPKKIQHRCHPCPLFLRIVKKFHCNVCLRMSKLPLAYECRECEFYMDAECAHFSSAIVKDDQAEHILHFCHQHPLQLFKDPIKRTTRDVILERKIQCFVCRSPSLSPTYGCTECDVFVHKPCLDVLPQILSIGWDQSVLVRLASAKQCAECSQSFSGFFFYSSKPSDCYCVPCGLLKVLSIRINPSSVWIQHPCHPCSLILKYFATFTCNACFRDCSTHAYYCSQCDFYMGSRCKYLETRFPARRDWIQHFCHFLPLQPSKYVDVSKALCRICGIQVRYTRYPDSCYSCRERFFGPECHFDAHKSCLDNLLQKIDHHYFGRTLVLLTTPSFECILCRKESDSGLAYRSIERGFKLCMECFFRPKSKLNDDGTLTSIHHWHQLSLVNNSEKDAHHCLLCGGYNSGVVLYYHCELCKGYFHKDCAELPFEMRHPLHPRHPLTLISTSQLPKSRRNCSLCLRSFPLGETHLSGIYHCKECSFQLDMKCAGYNIPSIYYQGHPHLLTIVEYMYDEEDCRVCSASCKISTCAFRCVECKFSIHLSCGPLPCDIKHPCHVHPLVLEDFYVEENYTDKFPCHVCENERDPMLPVYRCPEGCPMVSEIGCAMSEVMPKLLGNRGREVALRTKFPNVESRVIPRDEISKCRAILKGREDVSTTRSMRHINLAIENSLDYAFARSTRVCWEMRSTTVSWERAMLESHDKEFEHTDEDEDKGDEKKKKKNYLFSKEAFIRFSRNLGYTLVTLKNDGLPEIISQHNGPAAGEEHFLPQTLVPIYQEIIAKYCALYRPRNLTYPESISYFVSILCAVLHNMRTTRVVDVTSKRVREWLSLLKLVELAGFDVGFAVDKIKRVWDAHFLTKAKAIADETSDRLRRRREELSGLEKDLVMKLEATRKEMEEIEKQEGHHHKYLGNGMKSLRKEYADSLLIKWRPCSTDII